MPRAHAGDAAGRRGLDDPRDVPGRPGLSAEAERAYRRAIALEPGNEIAHHNLGALLVRNGEAGGTGCARDRAQARRRRLRGGLQPRERLAERRRAGGRGERLRPRRATAAGQHRGADDAGPGALHARRSALRPLARERRQCQARRRAAAAVAGRIAMAGRKPGGRRDPHARSAAAQGSGSAGAVDAGTGTARPGEVEGGRSSRARGGRRPTRRSGCGSGSGQYSPGTWRRRGRDPLHRGAVAALSGCAGVARLRGDGVTAARHRALSRALRL